MAANQSKELIDIDGLNISLIRSSRRRTLTLEVDHKGIRARAPKRLALREIIKFVRLKKGWLQTQLKNAPLPASELSLEHGSSVPFNGLMVPINIASGRGPIKLNYVNEQPFIKIPVVSSHLPVRDSVSRKLKIWYREILLAQTSELVAQILPTMGDHKPPPLIKVRDYKRRWGSCDHRGNLSFNWRLVMAPEAVQRYVVIHELAHRTEFNHSKRFWQIVSEHEPEWKNHQQWLQANGFELYRL